VGEGRHAGAQRGRHRAARPLIPRIRGPVRFSHEPEAGLDPATYCLQGTRPPRRLARRIPVIMRDRAPRRPVERGYRIPRNLRGFASNWAPKRFWCPMPKRPPDGYRKTRPSPVFWVANSSFENGFKGRSLRRTSPLAHEWHVTVVSHAPRRRRTAAWRTRVLFLAKDWGFDSPRRFPRAKPKRRSGQRTSRRTTSASDWSAGSALTGGDGTGSRPTSVIGRRSDRGPVHLPH